MSSIASDFIDDLTDELLRAEEHGPYRSHHEAYAVILEELDEYWELVRMKRDRRDPKALRWELIQIACTAWRAARSLGLEPHLDRPRPGMVECKA